MSELQTDENNDEVEQPVEKQEPEAEVSNEPISNETEQETSEETEQPQKVEVVVQEPVEAEKSEEVENIENDPNAFGKKWEPIVKLQQEGDYKGAYEIMKGMPDFDKMAENPGMPEFIALNEAGEYKAAYDGLMKLKIEKFGAEKLESWGFEVTEHTVKPVETADSTTIDQEQKEVETTEEAEEKSQEVSDDKSEVPETKVEQPVEQPNGQPETTVSDGKSDETTEEKPPLSPKPTGYSALTESEVAKAVIAQARENRFEEEDNKPAPRPFKDHRGKFSSSKGAENFD